ncbi:2-polyprenyl-3-methyl-5-hydroxy-6-metoxy-1,4-benzoquinol methylase [Rhizobiales bacterium GAS191]|nr:2-polyprenyl-3-methyl-5-hydroxy-6-metoxy-1,4-benzoquinol methylase [Rhizobiales bacterium GAS191]
MHAADYGHYSKWKRWDPRGFLVCTPHEASYFAGELRNVLVEGARVLEIGFGNGNFLRFASDRGATVSGTELLDEAVASARRCGIRVYRPDLSDAAAESAGQFDLIAAFDVLEHMTFDEIIEVFESLSRLLKVGGHVIARFPNGQSPLGRVPQYGDHTHRSVLSSPLLMQLLLGKPWMLERADNPFVVVQDQGLVKGIGLRLRVAGRGLVERAVNRLYGLDVTLDPNVTVLLRRI